LKNSVENLSQSHCNANLSVLPDLKKPRYFFPPPFLKKRTKTEQTGSNIKTKMVLKQVWNRQQKDMLQTALG
jgi:hypothetical protein